MPRPTTERTGDRRLHADDAPAVPDALVLHEGLPLPALEQRIGAAYAGAGLRHRVVAFYLREVDARGLHQLAGFRTAAQYATARFGMSRREARDLLAAGHALERLPVIDEAFCRGRLCWSKVRELIKVAAAPHEQRWLDLALQLPIDGLALEVRLARPGEPPRDRDDRKGLPEIRLRLDARVPPDVFAKWQRALQKISDAAGTPLQEWERIDAAADAILAWDPPSDDGPPPGGGDAADPSPYTVVVFADTPAVETDDGQLPITAELAETLACDAGGVLVSGRDERRERRVPAWMRRKVLARDRHRCRCCGARLRLQAHHVVPWSEGGPTSVSNLLTLCRSCHALVHAGLVRVVGDADDACFRDADGRPLHDAAPGPGRYLGDPQTPGAALLHRAEAAAAPTRAPDEHDAVPAEIDARWWTRRAHRLRWSEADGAFALRPGEVADGDTPARRAARCAARLDDVIGQPGVVASLRQCVQAARWSGEPLGHTLLDGPPGLGKSMLARAVAGELGAPLHAVSGPMLPSPRTLVRVLAGLGEGDVLFVDEVHAVPRAVAEVLYEALQDRRLSLLVHAGGRTTATTLSLPRFTLVGATTDLGLMPEPLLGRFVNREHLSFYDPPALAAIIRRAAQCAGTGIDADAAGELALVSRRTPREALRLLRRVRAAAVADRRPRIDLAVVARTLDRMGIDGRGLGPVDRAYLHLLRQRGPHRPIGLHRLAAALGVPARTLERLHEPYLLRLGLVAVTPLGRVAQCADSEAA